MSTEPRILPGESTGDLAFNPTLRIPPLLDPVPFLGSRRPSPLEPNARVNDGSHDATARLTSRSKALDDARPVGDDEVQSTFQTKPPITNVSTETASLPETSRKRQKVDTGYFQLPNPTTKPSAQKPPPFKLVPVLNELHEPPPSAALFPPITPSTLVEPKRVHLPSSKARREGATHRKQSTSNAKDMPGDSAVAGAKVRAKRICLRGRLKWTESETQDLMKGVGIYGVGKWKKILTHPDLNFHQDRTMVDLKDRYRTCRMNEEKAIERQATKEGSKSTVEKDTQEVLAIHKLKSTAKKANSKDKSKNNTFRIESELQNSPESPHADFNVYTPTNFTKQALVKGKKPGGAQSWTLEEDASLSKGYQKYGFQWTAIAKDKELCLSHRTGPQVRDRFRMKYPVVYQSSVPLPLPEVTRRPSRGRSIRKRSVVDDASQSQRNRGPAELRFIINETIKPLAQRPELGPSCTTLPILQHRPGTSSLQPGTSMVPTIADRFSGLDVQPLPDPDTIDDEHSESEVSDSASFTGSRHSIAEEDARHFSILLNDDVERSRLPPFKYPFDNDWHTEGNVTLPPLQPSLLWEEIASRPIFDLE